MFSLIFHSQILQLVKKKLLGFENHEVLALPDFSHKGLVEQEAQGEKDQALDDGGHEHPAQGICGEWVLIGVNVIATEDLDLYVHPGQLRQPIPKAKLGED